ncbi:MAG: sulfurtransferase TusA family protein [Caulobacteraceae bacterium]
MSETEIVVDARGHRCPVPTLRLAKALNGAAPGALVRLLADDPMAAIDVPHFAAQKGLEVLEVSRGEATTTFVVRASPLAGGPAYPQDT